MKLLGIVILYYPDDSVVKNIATYLAQLDETGEGKSFWMVAVKIWALVLR